MSAPEQASTGPKIEELRKALQDNRREVTRRGHTWDIGDVMGVIYALNIEEAENCGACRACVPNYRYMRVCSECGNKRCPHAGDHRNVCTHSNEPGQKIEVHRTPDDAIKTLAVLLDDYRSEVDQFAEAIRSTADGAALDSRDSEGQTHDYRLWAELLISKGLGFRHA